jgi:hypothetical protein
MLMEHGVRNTSSEGAHKNDKASSIDLVRYIESRKELDRH